MKNKKSSIEEATAGKYDCCTPSHILDDDGRWGCHILLNLVYKAQPKIHIFGHCHQNGQQNIRFGNTTFCNVAVNF